MVGTRISVRFTPHVIAMLVQMGFLTEEGKIRHVYGKSKGSSLNAYINEAVKERVERQETLEPEELEQDQLREELRSMEIKYRLLEERMAAHSLRIAQLGRSLLKKQPAPLQTVQN